MRGLSREMESAIFVLVLTGAIVLAFPFSAIGFRPKPARAASSASAAFVVLTAEERVAALKAAKTAWQSDESEKQGLRLRLPLGELPEEEQDALIRACELLPERVVPEPVAARLPPWKPSLKASAPVRLAPEDETLAPPAFSREELLQMN